MSAFTDDKFLEFCKLNPLRFSEKRIITAIDDFYSERKGTITDELADFMLWAEGYPSRHHHFGNYLLKYITKNNWRSVLEVGCGESFLLADYLFEKSDGSLCVTAMDICKFNGESNNIELIQKEFTYNENIGSYDLIIGQEPCEAAEHIVKACTQQKKPFFVILCGAPHKRLSGELDKDVYSWYDYLRKEYPQCGFGKWEYYRFSSGCIYSQKYFDIYK